MDFRITYEYGIHTDKETVVKNCLSELHAKMKLQEWLRKKYGDGELRVFICNNNDIFSVFGDIFKGFR